MIYIIRKFLDWYIYRYHSEEFIHKSLIADEIKERIDNAITRNNIERDTQLEEVVNTERTKFDIKEQGYIAEIKTMENIVLEAKKMRRNVEDLYFRVIERARQLSIIAAQNKHERTEIINDLSASMGKLDKTVLDIIDVEKDIEKNLKKDQEALEIDDT